jgi:hypothetical protein
VAIELILNPVRPELKSIGFLLGTSSDMIEKIENSSVSLNMQFLDFLKWSIMRQEKFCHHKTTAIESDFTL